MRVFALALLVAACGDVRDELADAGADAGAEAPDGGAADAGPGDAGVMPTPSGTVVYDESSTHSPVTTEVAASLRAIAARAARAGNVVSRVGDSNTVNTNFLSCLSGSGTDLDGRTALEPVLTHFRGGVVNGGPALLRTSLCAQVGWSAGAALQGAPSPLQQEIDAASPRFATVMFGTNDVGAADPYTYGRNLMAIVDALAAQGVVPLVTSVPPRDDNATADLWVGRYNLVARAVAQRRQVPFLDLHRALRTVPAHGLGLDGVHLNVFVQSGARGCVFSAQGLDFGHNVRNLLTLEALARAKAALDGVPAPDDGAARREGAGTLADPLVIDTLPFVDARDTRVDGEARIDTYPGCQSAANEGGREVLYRLELAQATNVRIFAAALGSADVDVHVLSAPSSGGECVQRNDKVVVRQLAAGTHWLALDTYVSQGLPQAGEYVLVVARE